MRHYWAHSRRGDIPAQSYDAHIGGVYRRALAFAGAAEAFSGKTGGRLRDAAAKASIWHDLGKLDEKNQAVLGGEVKQGTLPVNHVDAGVAHLLSGADFVPALAVYAHHRGLPNIPEEEARGAAFFRDERPAVREETERELPDLVELHHSIVAPGEERATAELEEGPDPNVFYRMLLSCLADADHSDTAENYGESSSELRSLPLRAEERLKQLDDYVSGLSSQDERGRLRGEMYRSCRDARHTGAFVSCDSPVGSGKTTAVMAHLLSQAKARGLRRIIVVLPFTNIISQSVEVYRKALTLPGETPENVVAELHCRAEFEDRDTRHLTALWRAPIVVMTAVTFFETLASNRPATLRRLHELPGSAIFVDEAHACLPLKLLRLAWRWMNALAEDWGCYWVLASGSLVRFWQIDDLTELCPKVPEIVDEDLRKKLMRYEEHRVRFRWEADPLSFSGLIRRVQDAPGPRLLIVNTIRKAACLAEQIRRVSGRSCVEHLSTALSAADREKTIARVRRRLSDSGDRDWTLVATSCVEAGVDFSFRTGFRELFSLVSLLQASGRVNRHGGDSGAEMWSFRLQDELSSQRLNSDYACTKVLEHFFNAGVTIAPQLSTESICQEIVRDDSFLGFVGKLDREENSCAFRDVAEDFVVIEKDTVTALADPELAEEIRRGHGDWRSLQRLAFNVRRSRLKSWRLKELGGGVYQWTLPYDDFLGYMAGVIADEKSKSECMIF